MRPRSVPSRKDQAQSRLGKYKCGLEIGRGGYATVFQALNTETGDFVAIKRVSLQNIDQDDLNSIEHEISLLKKLHNPNIVKYIDTIKTQDYLHIVLEYMENGSLANVMKKFGQLDEGLIAIYIRQVLHGLAYLHEQGVMHRDIKGANILITKDGQVKLADFGVAMNFSDSDGSNSVVGTPYWMAPEIIEMSTPTPKCDVWAVGCTVLELLTGKPPYFDLAPMAALFRIVQDDYPPVPESVSSALRDFLSQCFMKQPQLRKSADELLVHPWITSQRRFNEMHTAGRFVDSGDSCGVSETITNTIRLYAEQVAAAAAGDTTTTTTNNSSSNNKNDSSSGDADRSSSGRILEQQLQQLQRSNRRSTEGVSSWRMSAVTGRRLSEFAEDDVDDVDDDFDDIDGDDGDDGINFADRLNRRMSLTQSNNNKR